MVEHDVLVIGAGPTGLTAALELARRGIHVRVVDQQAAPSTETRALGVQARTLELFQRSGVTGDLLARGVRAGSFNIFSEGRQVARAEFGQLPTPYPFVLMVPQHEVEAALAARLAAHGVTVERDVRLTSLTVQATYAEVGLRGTDGVTVHRRYPWVIGADGAHSTVRRLLDVGFLGTAFQESFAVADLRIAWDRPPTEFFAFLDRGRFAAFFPMPRGWHRVAIAERRGEQIGRDDAVTQADLQVAIDRTVPGRPEITDVRQAGRFRINQRRAAASRIGSVFLAGDAAHIHSVVGAQGMNTGIQDAINLAWKLASVIDGTAHAELLTTYESERGPVAARLVQGTRRVTRMTLLRRPFPTWARRHLAPFVLGSPAVQEKLTRAVSQVDVSYHDRRAAAPVGRVRVGDRAPDVDVTPGSPLSSCGSATGYTVLDFGVGTAETARLRRGGAVPVVVVEIPAGSAAWRTYKVEAPTLILIRPDGYIAADGSPESIREHLYREQRETR